MGTWGTGTFENDTAADWVYELEAATDLTPIAAAFDAVAAGAAEYLDADVAATGLAAAEVVAALRGQPAAELPEAVQDWLAQHRPPVAPALLARARAAVETIRAHSELQELWAESDDSAVWQAAVDELRTRLA